MLPAKHCSLTQPSPEGRALKKSEAKVYPTGGDLEGASGFWVSLTKQR